MFCVMIVSIVFLQSFIDGIVGSVGTAVATTVQSSCRDAYNKLLLPGLNALTQQIFAQVNENFSRGTRECELKKMLTKIYMLCT